LKIVGLAAPDTVAVAAAAAHFGSASMYRIWKALRRKPVADELHDRLARSSNGSSVSVSARPGSALVIQSAFLVNCS